MKLKEELARHYARTMYKASKFSDRSQFETLLEAAFVAGYDVAKDTIVLFAERELNMNVFDRARLKNIGEEK